MATHEIAGHSLGLKHTDNDTREGTQEYAESIMAQQGDLDICYRRRHVNHRRASEQNVHDIF